LLKKVVPAGALAWLDGLAQRSGRWQQLTPSIFIQSSLYKQAGEPPTGFFACPECRASMEQHVDNLLICPQVGCGRRWRVENGLYDFKEPV
jgi:hypothetical protein